MTSIVIWSNQHEEEYFPGLWAISDSRVTNSGCILTDNFQKLTIVRGYSYADDDFYKQHPRYVFSVGFACAGSTLVSAAVREFMVAILSDLREIEFLDAPDMPFEDKVPPLEEIAGLTARVATRYILDLGQHYPRNARIEIAVYGYCAKKGALRVFRVHNSPLTPDSVVHSEVNLGIDDFFILGDKTAEVERTIRAKRADARSGTLDFARAPILALSEVAGDVTFETIGGSIQLCVAGRFGAKHIPLSEPGSRQQMFAGINLFENGSRIGGFSCHFSIGLSFPWMLASD